MDITRYEMNFASSSEGNDIFSCIWRDADCKRYRAVVQISHDVAEHIQRYQDFAIYLARRGYIVCGNDHIGHGLSVKDSNVYGNFNIQPNSWKNMIDDMNYLEETIRSKYQNIPYFILGTGMGSMLAREYVSAYGDTLDGAVFAGTSGPTIVDPLLSKLLEVVSEKNYNRQANTIYRGIILKNNRKIKVAQTDYDWLSTDREKVESYIEDVKCGFVPTYELYKAIFDLNKIENKRDWAEILPKNLPFLLISGKEDPVGNYGKGVKQVYNSMIKAGCSDVSIKLLYGARHDILNETKRDKVYSILYNWFEKYIY